MAFVEGRNVLERVWAAELEPNLRQRKRRKSGIAQHIMGNRDAPGEESSLRFTESPNNRTQAAPKVGAR
jgi:hypothetical protein